jgi:hypothetical protein
MITVNNIKKEYPKINQKILPDTLKKGEYKELKEMLDLYGAGSDKVDEYIETFVSQLNAAVKASRGKDEKPKPKSNGSTSAKGKTKPKAKPKTKAKTKAKPKTKTTTKAKAKTRKKTVRKKKKSTAKSVGSVDLQLRIIKSFTLLANKKADRKRVLNLYKRIEKAAAELRIRKTSKYANEISYISDKLKEAYNNQKGSTIEISVSAAKLKELKALGNSQKVLTSTRLIKRYVNLYDKNDRTKAKRLYDAVQKAFQQGKIPKSDINYDKMKTVQKRLRQYLEQGANLHPSQTELRGLAGTVGFVIPPVKAKKKS